VRTVADRAEAHDRAGQIQDHGERGAQAIEPEQRPAGRQADRKLDHAGRCVRPEEHRERERRKHQANERARGVDRAAAMEAARDQRTEHREDQQRAHAARS
jgi:hypothetical protein